MNNISDPRPGNLRPAFGLALLLFVSAAVHPAAAQTTYTWDGGGGTNRNWGTAANWVGDNVPTFNTNAILLFDTNVGTADTLFLGAQRQIRGIVFGANLTGGADNVFDIQTRTTLNGATGANLLFNGGATNASITLDDNTVLTRVRLGTGGVGAIALQTTTDVFHNAAGVVLQFDANTTGAGALNKHGVGAVTFTRAGSFNGLNLYGGTVVAWNTATALGSNSVTLGETGSSSNVSLFLGSANTYTNAITVSSGSGTRLLGNTDVTNQFVGLGFGAVTGNATLSGGIDLAAGKDVTFAITNYNASTDRMTVSGAVTGTGGLTKTGNGILLLTASNSYGGTTTVSEGVLAIANGNALGSTNADTVVASGAQLRLTNNVTVGNEALTISGTGLPAGDGAAGALRNESGDNTWGGLITLVANAIIEALTGTRLTLDVASGDAINLSSFTATFSGGGTHNVNDVIDGTGGLTKAGTGTLHLAARNRFTGATAVTGGVLNLNSSAGFSLESTASISVTNATLLISQSDQVNDSATVTLSGGTIQRGAGVSEVFGNLNITTGSFLDFGTGATGTLQFGDYTPVNLLTVQNFAQGNVLRFGTDVGSFLPTAGALTNSYFSFNNAFSYDSGSFTITAIPEPSTYLAAAGLVAVLMWPSRRRLLKDAKSILGLRRPMRDRLG